MSFPEIDDALQNPPADFVNRVPPVKPKAGESYIVECPNPQDWTCDQYQWVHKGKNVMKSSSGQEIVKLHFHIRLPGVKEGKGRSRANSSNKFKRSSYHMSSNPNRVLITYHGDEKLYVPIPHGNSKNNEDEYVRSTKSLLTEIKQTHAKPMTVYRNLSSKSDVAGEHQGVLNPRNLRQIKNHQAITRTKGRLSKDDIYNLIQLAYHLEGFVAEITVYPDLLTIFALPDIMNTFIELLQSDTDEPVSLVYDTTFNLGDFYVSPLVFRHVLFENTPWIPLAFLVHDRKLQKCHNRLFEFLAERVPILKTKKIPFITDREPALTKAVQMYFPNITVLHCWNHLKRDFKDELRKLGADSNETSVYLADWRKMAQCETQSQFESSYHDLTSKWAEKAKGYFDRHMKKDLLTHSGRWIIQEFPALYDPYSGITNNASESINAVLKRMTGWQELPVDSMLLSLFHLQNFYFVEIQRGRAGIGNYKLNKTYREAQLDKDELIMPNKIINPDEIIQYVKSSISDVISKPIPTKNSKELEIKQVTESSKNESTCEPSEPTYELHTELSNVPALDSTEVIEGPSATPYKDRQLSQKSLAKYVLDNKGVTHVPECNSYIVKGHKDKNYCVTLHPETCQCPSMTRCYHIIAVRMFVGLPVDTDIREISLRTLSKRSLKRSDKKSGRKKPRINDIDPIINPAPDSVMKVGKMQTPNSKKKLDFDSLLPTPDKKKTPKNKKKLRFIPLSPIESENQKHLPAKKRKVIGVSEPQPKPWIGNLNEHHKEKIVSNQSLCSDIMNEVLRILKAQFKDLQGLQGVENTPVWDEQDNKWIYQFKFANAMSPAAQIHHNGKYHWVSSAKVDGQIYLFDSLFHGSLSPSLQIQLASLYGGDFKTVTVRVPSIQQQSNGVDCGLFAIANVVQFCFGYYIGKKLIVFDSEYLRDHLVCCLEKGQMTPFPRVETKAKLNKKKITYIDIPCDCSKCRLPNLVQEMVGCDADKNCNNWRHLDCICKDGDSDDWFCTPHRNI